MSTCIAYANQFTTQPFFLHVSFNCACMKCFDKTGFLYWLTHTYVLFTGKGQVLSLPMSREPLVKCQSKLIVCVCLVQVGVSDLFLFVKGRQQPQQWNRVQAPHAFHATAFFTYFFKKPFLQQHFAKGAAGGVYACC